MESNYEGDLTDIVGARGNSGTEWQQFSSINPISYRSDPVEDFGDPFTQFGDPLLLDIIDSTNTTPVMFFHDTQGVLENINAEDGVTKDIGSIDHAHIKVNVGDDEMRSSKSSSIFSRMLQISPNAKLQVPNNIIDHALINSPNGSKVCLLESPTAAGVQISSPRNTGIKRRKSDQGKKVVCIPAPAPANSSNSSSSTRPSGEVVPSDLWAWRKYGQKPIKGSPYPRGYYRCSSSKGCLARKQVERSRTDPNMLMITYTSEHNHPWPTHRNALAGSTRSHHPTSKNTNAKDSFNPQKQTINPPHKQDHNKDTSIENPTNAASDHVKEELMDQDFDNDVEIEEGFSQSYKPTFLESCEDDFFAELGEIEADPLDLLFPLGGGDDNDEENNNKALDPFSFYDWPGTTSRGDAAKRDS